MGKAMRLAVCCICLLFSHGTASYAVTTFTYTLANSGKTSAGVYSNDTLLRTLWFDVPKNAGVNTGEWDNLDDDGHPVAPGRYEIRLLVHNVQYQWDGLVGNSSTNMSGATVHKGMYPLQDVAITGTKAFYTTGYNEAHYDFHRFDTRNPQVRLNSWTWVRDTRVGPTPLKQYDCYGPDWSFATTDGTHVYFACPHGWKAAGYSGNEPEGYTIVSPGYVVVNRVSDDGQADAFANGIELPFLGTPYVHPHGIRVGTQPGLSGLAVQQTGNLLAVAVAPDNLIYLVDKLSGDVLSKFPVTGPKRMAFDASNNLWISAGANVYCYRIASASPYSASLIKTLSGFSNALAVGVSPTEDLVIVADGGKSMQLKAFTTAGAALWTYGQAGGYQRHGPAVTDDKLWFCSPANAALVGTKENTFITFAPDGTFWVGDGINARTLQLSAAASKPHVIDRISMQPMSYCIAVDQNNASRVFRNFLEFNVDYSKPLGPANGSWTLVNNWVANLPTCYATQDGSAAGFTEVATLANGRTYTQVYRHEKNSNGAVVFDDHEIVELTATGVRPTGQLGVGALLEGGALYRAAPNVSNGSFESGDSVGWQMSASGTPTSWSAKARNASDSATDGSYYLHLQASGPTGGGAVAVTLDASPPSLASKGRTFTLSFDIQNKTTGFDKVIVDLLSVDSQGRVTASIQPSPPPVLHQDGAWHSYTSTLILPPSATKDRVGLRMSFLKEGAVASATYEANLDNIRLTQGSGNVLIDKGTQHWYRAPLTGFDASAKPQWGPEEVLATVYELPGSSNPTSSAVCPLTSSDIVVCYEPSLRNIRHLGGIRRGETNWAWKAFPSTNTDLKSYNMPLDYPIGYYDLGTNHKVYTGGNIALVSGRHIIAGYHGEGWHACQANQFMHFYDDGLFVGQFGVPGTDEKGNRWPPEYSKDGYAGNAFCPALANDGDQIYLYLNDEWGAPLQRYHLVGANSIQELSGTGALNGAIELTPMTARPERH